MPAAYVPTAQDVQVVDDVAFEVLEYFPGGQFSQVVDADRTENVPAMQPAQTFADCAPVVVANMPGLHESQLADASRA